MMKDLIPPYYEKRLADMEGRLPNGKSKNRLVFGPETKRVHGKLAGTYKYVDPSTGQPLECWIWETWYPASMCGERENWNYEFMGPYPADCDQDCCNGGWWGMRSPISTNGEYIPLTEETLLSMERKQFMDLGWSMESETSRLEQLDAALSDRNKKLDAEAVEEMHRNLDHYATHKGAMDNADNRVYSWADKYTINVPGVKMPIGGPKIKQ